MVSTSLTKPSCLSASKTLHTEYKLRSVCDTLLASDFVSRFINTLKHFSNLSYNGLH